MESKLKVFIHPVFLFYIPCIFILHTLCFHFRHPMFSFYTPLHPFYTTCFHFIHPVFSFYTPCLHFIQPVLSFWTPYVFILYTLRFQGVNNGNTYHKWVDYNWTKKDDQISVLKLYGASNKKISIKPSKYFD